MESTAKKKTKPITAMPLKRGEEDQRDDHQAVGRVPVGPHIAPDAENFDRTGKAGKAGAEREHHHHQRTEGKPYVHRRPRVRADDAQSQAERRPRHQPVDEEDYRNADDHPDIDGGAEESGQPVVGREGLGLRHGGGGIVEGQLDEDVRPR